VGDLWGDQNFNFFNLFSDKTVLLRLKNLISLLYAGALATAKGLRARVTPSDPGPLEIYAPGVIEEDINL